MDVWEKSKTVDPEVRAYVYSLVNAVGGSSTYDDSYAVGDDAVAVLKDITRWLRLYDEKLSRYDVKRCLAEANFVKGDLLEILAQWPEEATDNTLKVKLALACLQLLVPLSWPPELDQNIFHDDKFTVNHSRHLPFLQLAQVGYKRSMLHFENAAILRTAVRIALPAIAQPRRERSRRDEGIIKLALYLFRNLAFITQPQHLPSQGDENEISRSSTIEAFHQQDVFALLLTIGSSANDEFQDQDTVLIEILYHLLKGVDPTTLFMEQQQMAAKETDELQNLMHKEKAMLNNYKKFAPSRHNRFGTMIWVKRGDDKFSTVSGQSNIVDDSVTLKNMDSSKKWNKPKYRGKTNTEHEEETDFGMRVELTETARKHLRDFVADFLDSSFNPLFSGLRKAIERQADRVGLGHQRQYFYLAHWFLHAESARREQIQRANLASANNNISATPEENSFAYIAAVLDQETFVLLNRNLQRAFDEKNWQDLQATLLCFTQILLTVQSMAESKDEEDQEIADNIQSRIFYEETTHDLIVRILRGYTHQGFAYLDAITECVHVFVRMLERYSKQNVDLHIRSKRRARNKRKQKPKTVDEEGSGGGQSDAEDDAEDEREAHLAVSERKFDFTRFSSRFLSQGCVDTFVALTHFYQDLSVDQLKRCHRFFYRLAFKQDLAVLLFRVDILQLFHSMIKGRDCLNSKADGFHEWEQLVQQVFRRCIKWVERASEGQGWRGIAVVEMLFSKTPNSLFYLQNGYDVVREKTQPRAAANTADLQIKESVEEDRRISVAVALMLEKGKKDSVAWVGTELARALEIYQVWEAGRTAAHAEQELLEASDNANAERTVPINSDESSPAVSLIPDSDERKALMLHDQHLRLLLTTLGLKSPTDINDPDASWTIPSDSNTTWLSSICAKLSEAESNPATFDSGKSAQDMLRKAPTGRKGAIFSDDEDSGGESGGEINPSLFPPNIRSRTVEGADGEARPPKKRRLIPRNKTELTDAEAKKRAKERRKKEQERNGKIKSALYITAEDDASDEEADAEFFRLEEDRRKKTAGVIRSTLLKEAERMDKEKSDKKGKKRKSGVEKAGEPKKKKKRSSDSGEEDSDEVMDLDGGIISSDNVDDDGDGDDDEVMAARRSHLAALLGSDSDDDEEQDSDADSASAAAHRNNNMDTDEEQGEEESDVEENPTPQANDEPNLPLTDVSGNARTTAQTGAESDDEEHAPVRKPVPRRNNLRAGFIIDDSDSE